jgi:DNA-binding XRE family transcriptional regulator
MELVTLKDLHQAAQQTQAQLTAVLGVGQDTIFRLEVRRKSTQRRTCST